MKFSLVIPCYNESKNLPSLFESCQKLTVYSDIEIIFVDNGSTDNTKDVLNKLLPLNEKFRSLRIEKNIGYGFGILSGLKNAKGDILGWTHADMQTNPQDILKGLKLFNHKNPNIFVKGLRHGRLFSDVFFTIGMSVFESFLLRKPLWDINAQPTMFHRSFYESWQDPPRDFSLDLYAYYLARIKKIPIYRFDVKFGKRLFGVSHWNINWKAKWKFIKRTIEFSMGLSRKLEKK